MGKLFNARTGRFEAPRDAPSLRVSHYYGCEPCHILANRFDDEPETHVCSKCGAATVAMLCDPETGAWSPAPAVTR